MIDRRNVIFLVVLLNWHVMYADEALLAFLVEQNEAARGKVRTAKYSVKWTDDHTSVSYSHEQGSEKGFRHNEGIAEVKRKGSWRHSISEINASQPDAGVTWNDTSRCVVNDRYVGVWPEFKSRYIYQYDHLSPKQMSRDVSQRVLLNAAPDMDVFDVAFGGAKGTTFKEMMKLPRDDIKWTAEEMTQPNGDTIFFIKRYCPAFMNDSTKPDAAWTVDPQKGFLVTQSVFYNKGGHAFETRKIKPKEIGEGIWLPVSYEEQRIGRITDIEGGKEPHVSRTIQLENISVNSEISDDDFAIESIWPVEYRKSTVLMRKGLDGSNSTYIYRNGKLVLREDWVE